MLSEPESPDMFRFLEESDDQPVSSVISDVELIRAVLRQDSKQLDRALEILAQLVLLPITESIRSRAAYLSPARLGSLDAIHLATAIELHSDITMLLSYDNRLVEAARDAGLTAVSPGV